jgi:protein TonB
MGGGRQTRYAARRMPPEPRAEGPSTFPNPKEQTMQRHAQPQGGLRLAFADLPPTLQPHAVLSCAPRPDRRISALAATCIYLGLAAATLLLGRASATIRIRQTGGNEKIWQFPPEPHPSPAALPGLPARAAVSTPATLPEARPLPAETLVPPAETPTRLPGVDDSAPAAHPATGEGSREGRIPGPFIAGAGPGPSTGEIRGSSDIRDVTANPPRVLTAVTPSYPAMARNSHLQGPVELLMTIDEHGAPVRVQVLSGHAAFHAEAERAARLWRFEPATVEGRPVPARFRLTISFRLS